MEYAIEAIKLGSTAVGIQTKEGVVLAVEKRLTSPLLEPSSVEKVCVFVCGYACNDGVDLVCRSCFFFSCCASIRACFP